MVKKFWTLLSLLMIAAMVLTACGGGAQATEAPAAEEPAATEAPAAEEPAAEEPAATEAPAAEEPVATEAPAAEEPAGEAVNLLLWTQEGQAENAFQFVQSLAEAYTAENPGVVFEVVNKDTEALREDFQTASLAGSPPDLLWTVNDHAGPFTAAGLIMPVDDLVDTSMYVPGALEAVQLDGQTWGVPISSGNHLMLLYNKELIQEPPETIEDLITVGKELTVEGTDTVTGTYGLVYDQTEPFWLVPWLGGFGGQVFAEDGLTPTLNTPEMVNTLSLLKRFKDEGIVPQESNYATMDALFKEGNAAMIVNGDWSLGGYRDIMGDNLGVAAMPAVEGGGTPKPYTSGKYFMIPEGLDEAKLDAVLGFINWVTSEEQQLEQVRVLNRLPANLTALENELVTDDPILAGSAEQMAAGAGMPAVLEMRCNWDSMKPEMAAVLSGAKDPETAATDMQSASETCISQLE
jgi:arabinogalactan oligomer/maltooligosaccharide transport system substrate-binding protein